MFRVLVIDDNQDLRTPLDQEDLLRTLCELLH